MDRTVSSISIRGGASVLAINSADNRLIAAGQQSKNKWQISRLIIRIFIKIDFQLFAIEQIDNTEQFIEIHDFRSTPRQSAVSRWCALQPKDVAWSPNDG